MGGAVLTRGEGAGLCLLAVALEFSALVLWYHFLWGRAAGDPEWSDSPGLAVPEVELSRTRDC